MTGNKELEKHIKYLMEYNKRIDELERSKFIDWLNKNKLGFILTIGSIKNNVVSSKPDIDHVKSFLTDYRKLFLKREWFSLGKLKEVYNKLSKICSGNEEILKIINQVERFCDSGPIFGMDFKDAKEVNTNNEFQEIIINGRILHEDGDKKAIYDKWTKEPFTEDYVMEYFYFILKEIFIFLKYIKEINKKTIEELKVM